MFYVSTRKELKGDFVSLCATWQDATSCIGAVPDTANTIGQPKGLYCRGERSGVTYPSGHSKGNISLRRFNLESALFLKS